jgi:hypothetical protein
MKHLQTLLLLLLISSSVTAQSYTGVAGVGNATYPKLFVTTLEPLNFYYNNAAELLTVKTISNAIKVNLETQQQNCVLLAQVIVNDNQGNAAFSNNLSLKLNSTNSPNAAGGSIEKKLSQTPSLLFVQSNTSTELKQYEFIYDLKVAPPTTVTGNANFSFIITFTITQQ